MLQGAYPVASTLMERGAMAVHDFFSHGPAIKRSAMIFFACFK